MAATGSLGLEVYNKDRRKSDLVIHFSVHSFQRHILFSLLCFFSACSLSFQRHILLSLLYFFSECSVSFRRSIFLSSVILFSASTLSSSPYSFQHPLFLFSAMFFSASTLSFQRHSLFTLDQAPQSNGTADISTVHSLRVRSLWGWSKCVYVRV